MNKKAISRIAVAAAAGALMAGCAAPQNPDPRDPWEGFNRGIYKFNDTVDRAVFKPVAQAYTFVTPEPVRSCVHNIFSNVGDLWSGTNSFLQGRGHDFVNTLGRFLFNTTMGVGGCFDVASANGARRIPNDFGTTLGVWGLGQGPYLVLPFFGSSTVRDGAGLVGDYAGTTYGYMGVDAIDNVRLRNSLWGLRVVDTRASLLDATDTVDRVALDPYSFVRDAYLQRRAAMVLGHKVDDESSLPNYEDDEDDAAPAEDIPAAQQAMSDAVATGRTEAESAETDLQRANVLNVRSETMCESVPDGDVTDWIGTVVTVDANGEGKAVVVVSIEEDIEIGTWNNALSDSGDRTLIEQGSELYDAALELAPGDSVRFSGTLKSGSESNDRCYYTSNLTEVMSIESPDYIITFSELQKIG
jgi:phospholipid-binding lipoprotein MlaA